MCDDPDDALRVLDEPGAGPDAADRGRDREGRGRESLRGDVGRALDAEVSPWGAGGRVGSGPGRGGRAVSVKEAAPPWDWDTEGS